MQHLRNAKADECKSQEMQRLRNDTAKKSASQNCKSYGMQKLRIAKAEKYKAKKGES